MLRTKLHRPPVTNEHVYRDHLIDLLDKNKYKPVTLVSAGAGYGKSMLVSSWLEKYDTPYAWISLNADDDNLKTFLEYLEAGIKLAIPDAIETFSKVIKAVDLPPIKIIAEILINDLDEITQDFIIVLDDYHLIRDPKIHELFDIFLKYPPQHIHLIIITRRDPLLDLNRIRAHSRINEIRMSELGFSREEIGQLFKNLIDIDLNSKTIGTLHSKTEGWITGLRLTSLSIKDPENAERVLDNLSGNLHFISNYLIEEVLAQVSDEVRANLLRTSILNRFCADMIDQINSGIDVDGDSDKSGKEFIDWLIKSSLFIIPLDDRNEWFRYHHLFQELLQNQLKKNYNKEALVGLHLLASNWFENNGFIEEGIFHAVESGDLDKAALIIARNRQDAVNNDKWYILDRWLAMLPESYILTIPELLMAKSWVLIHHFYFEEVLEKIALVQNICNNKDEYQSTLGEVSFFRGYILYFMGDGKGSLEQLENALDNIPHTFFEARALAEAIYSMATNMVGDKEGAIRYLDNLMADPKQTSDIRICRLLTTYVFNYTISSDLHRAIEVNKKLWNASIDRFAYSESMSTYLQGIIHLYRFEVNKMITELEKALNLRYIQHKRTAVDSITALMLAYQLSGRFDLANNTLQTLREFIEAIWDPSYQLLLDTAEIRLLLMQGKKDEAHKILKTITLPPFEPAMTWWVEIPSITVCRGLIAIGSEGSLQEAEQKLIALSQHCANHYNVLHLIEIQVLNSLMYAKMGKLEEAGKCIREALSNAQAGSVLFPFIEGGKPMLDLLELVDAGSLNPFKERIIDIIKTSQTSTGKIESKTEQNKVVSPNGIQSNESLSLREVEILTLVAEGLRNKEIAEKLFISDGTIKKHIYNIAQKLGTTSRIGSVRKAEEMGLI